jgi:hypothetical protein
VLKTTGSAFENFIRDEYTTLPEVDDRIFSTSIDLVYKFSPFTITVPSDEKKLEFKLGQCAFGKAPVVDSGITDLFVIIQTEAKRRVHGMMWWVDGPGM